MLRRVLPPCLLLLAACSSSAGGKAAQEVEDLIARQRYPEAVRAASELRERRPDDPRAIEVHRRATVAFLLEQGRRATFEDHHEEALEHLEHAARLAPESPAVQAWLAKVRGTFARRWHARALDLHAAGNLEAAGLAYEQVLHYDPASESAVRGLAEVGVQLDYRAGLGERYYDEAVRALFEHWLERARSRFSYAGKYLGDGRSALRERQVEQLLAEQRLEVARELEEQGLFAAAASDYGVASRLDPALGEARSGRERALREAEASQRLREAEMDIVRREYDRALMRLAEGIEMTELQAERFNELREQVTGARLEHLYLAALDRERDFRYEDAIEAYDRLLERADFYKDARTRRDTLQDYVGAAELLWDQAEAAQDPARELELLRRIAVFWPEYRDLPQRITALEARLAR